MELQITGIKVELTPTIRRRIKRKFDKLGRHSPSIIESRVEITEQRTKSPQQRFLVRVTVDNNGTLFHGEERGEDLLTAVDRVVAVMARQVEHYKGKRYQKGRSNSSGKGEFGEEIVEIQSEPKVVKVKRFAVKPMSVAEATDQMLLLGHAFFLFFNADTEELNLLYRRKDGNYGLIEPELG